jgi:purine-binding chemotaxis protein CheW
LKDPRVRDLGANGEAVVGETQEILSCRVAGTEFGLPMTQLREVVDLVEIVRVQRDSSLAEGIINYRGSVIPVVDARKALGLPPVDYSVDAHIVITDTGGEKTGLIVDQVLDVFAVESEAIERPGARVPLRQFVSGIAKLDDRLLLILDLETLLGQRTTESVAELTPTMAGGSESGQDDGGATLRQRALELSRPVELAREQLGDMVTMVCFTLSQGAYAIRADFTREIVMPPPMTPIPCTPDSIMGAVNIRGVIMPVIGLATMLGLQPADRVLSSDARIVVGDAKGALLGMLVDGVLGISEVSSQDIVPALGAVEMQTVGFIEGEFDYQGRPICVIDAPAIVGALEALDAAAAGLVKGAGGSPRQEATHGQT